MEKTFEKIGAIGAAALIASMGFAPAALAVTDQVNLGDVADYNDNGNNANPNSNTANVVNANNAELATKWRTHTGDNAGAKILKTIKAPAAALDMAGQTFTFHFEPIIDADDLVIAEAAEDTQETVTFSQATYEQYVADVATDPTTPNPYEGVTWDNGQGTAAQQDGQTGKRSLGKDQEVGVYPIPSDNGQAIAGCQIADMVLTAEDMDSYADVQKMEGDIVLPNAANYQHAGIYEYIVTETPEATHSEITSGGRWFDSKNQYLMRVYVINVPNNGTSGTSLAIDAVTVEQQKDTNFEVDAADNEYGTAFDTGVKVDPEDDNADPRNSTTPDGTYYPGSGKDDLNSGEDDGTESGFEFADIYLDNDNELYLSKIVTGNYGDKTELFDFSVELQVPDYVPLKYVNAIASAVSTASPHANTGNNTVIEPDSLTQAGTVAVDATDNHKVTITGIKMHSNSFVKVSNLPLGTKYVVTETSTGAHYTGTSQFTNYTGDQGAAVTTNSGSAGKNAQLDVDNPQAQGTPVNQTTTIMDGVNDVVVTNAFDDTDISPTGIITQALPYLVLIAVPAAGLLYIAARRRKQED